MSSVLVAVGTTVVFAVDRSHQQAANNFEPGTWHKQMCIDHYARHAGRIAYIEAKLSLTDAQRPLFENWKDAVLGSAKSRESHCLGRMTEPGRPREHTILEREAFMKKLLQDRLADLTAKEPSLTALYNSLSPEQKQAFDRSGPMGVHMRAMDRGGPMGGRPDVLFIRRGWHDGQPPRGPDVPPTDGQTN